MVPSKTFSRQGAISQYHTVDSVRLWQCRRLTPVRRFKYSARLGKTRSMCSSLFLHTTDIGTSQNYTVKCSERGCSGQSILQAPRSQGSYALHFHAVDRNDRNSADYTVLIRTNRLAYLRFFFWILDRVVHILLVVVDYCAKSKLGWSSRLCLCT